MESDEGVTTQIVTQIKADNPNESSLRDRRAYRQAGLRSRQSRVYIIICCDTILENLPAALSQMATGLF